ncbi:TPA: hypothetical protein DIS57_04255 [Candidatus Wolfebacteria bacterium]|nr:hypothetical protein [Candidatus Wolfebacteria bacterium]
MLTKKETEQLATLLGKIEDPHSGLPQPVFDALCDVVPFIACELVVMNEKGEILLTWREDQWWKGWHFPGGLMRYRETVDERIKKMAIAEVGLHIKKYKFLFPLNYWNSPRGSGVSLVFLSKSDRPAEGTFFKTMPKDIIPEHRILWKNVRKAIWDTKRTSHFPDIDKIF